MEKQVLLKLTAKRFISTWKEERKRSVKSLVRRRLLEALVDSSVRKMKTTGWIPSRGMRVRVDLASLRWRGGVRGNNDERRDHVKRGRDATDTKIARPHLNL